VSSASLLLPELDAEVAITRRVLERVPDGRGEWKPHAKSFPMGHLAQLVARLPGWAPMVMRRTELDVAPVSGPEFPGYSFERTATLLAELDANSVAARQAIASATDADFDVPWSFQRAGQLLQTESRYLMLRSLLLNHLVRHCAQLGGYLRLVDVPVPQMYGPTADER
jgi:hypothetical protein